MKQKLLIFFTAILIVLFPLSFIIEKKQNSFSSVKTAFLNPKNEREIDSIILQDQYSSLVLKNKSDNENVFFVGGNNEMTYVFPVEQNTVKNFISSLKKIRNLYKVDSTGNILNKENFSFKITYILKNGMETELLFGKNDITGTKRFLKLKAKNEVFKTDSDFDAFLTTNSNFWVLPEIIYLSNKEKINAEEIQKITLKTKERTKNILPSSKDFLEKADSLLSLRHGKLVPLYDFTENKAEKAECIEIEFDEDAFFCVEIFKNNDDYVLLYKNKNLNYACEISAWTYEKLFCF